MSIDLRQRLSFERIKNYRGVSTRLTSATIDRLDAIAKANESTLGAVIRVAVESFLEGIDKDPELVKSLTTRIPATASAEAR